MRLHHTGIATKNADRLVQFYCDNFGGKVLRRHRWDMGNNPFNHSIGLAESAGLIVLIGFEESRLEIFEFSVPVGLEPTRPMQVSDLGLTHICFETSDCFTEYHRLCKLGVPFNAAPLKMPAGGVFAYARDPDGNIVEILQAPPVSRD